MEIKVMNDMVENNAIYRPNDYALCMKYHKDTNSFIWCRENGEIIRDDADRFGIKRVILSPKIVPLEYTLVGQIREKVRNVN